VKRFRDRSIQGKLLLIVTLISSASLLLAGTTFVTYELVSFRRQMPAQLGALADLIAASSAAAVAFDYQPAAQESLDALRAQEHVRAACLYGRDGRVFAAYRKDSIVQCPPPDPRGDTWGFETGDIVLFRRMTFDNDPVGTVYIRSDVRQMYARMRRHVVLVALVLLGSLLLTFALSALLQKVITKPILDLARVATQVSIDERYSVRAERRGGGDEIAILIDGFNAMLARVEERDAQLQAARQALAQRVEQRTSALRESERRFRDVLQNLRLLTVLLDRTGNVTFCNDHFLQLTGWDRSDVLGHDFFERFVAAPGRDVARAEYLRKVAAGQIPMPEEGEIVTREGVPRLISWAHTLLREPIHGIVGNASVGSDVTDEKLREERRRLSQKLEAVGRLAGGVAHDFNNLLTIILGYSDLVLLSTTDPTLTESIREVKKAAERAASLTRQLLAFSRRQVLQPKVLDLNLVVLDTEKMLRRLIGEDIHLLTVAAHDLGHVKADRGQVEQVLMNLVVNARDAMPKGGKVTIEAANVDLDADYARAHGVVQPGRYVRLSVTDTGHGMDAPTKSRAFEPFFTTKKEGKGTGLGLATVYGIVKQSGGYIWVYSEPERGTTFKIYLPRIEAEADAAPVLVGPAAALRGTESVLVVEDDESLRRMSTEALTLFGFRVLQAPSAEDALALVDRGGEKIDLVLTDMVLPLMGGKELAEQLLARRPDVKVVFMSGYAEQAALHQGLIDPSQAFLTKPFTPEILVRKLRDVLDAGQGPGGR
jgi:PAS domain S-box-containing protein